MYWIFAEYGKICSGIQGTGCKLDISILDLFFCVFFFSKSYAIAYFFQYHQGVIKTET